MWFIILFSTAQSVPMKIMHVFNFYPKLISMDIKASATRREWVQKDIVTTVVHYPNIISAIYSTQTFVLFQDFVNFLRHEIKVIHTFAKEKKESDPKIKSKFSEKVVDINFH